MKSHALKLSLIKIFDKAVNILTLSFLIVLICGFSGFTVTFLTLISALFHELGHMLAARFFLAKCKLNFRFNGMKLNPDTTFTYKETIIVALCGPLSNFLLCIVCLPFCFVSEEILQAFALINALTGLSNLMLIKGYDGYKILQSIFSAFGFQKHGDACLNFISGFLCITICFISLFLMAWLNTGYWSYILFFSQTTKAILNQKS